MLEWLGRYFTSIAAAGLISALACACVPESGKAAVKFTGGLLVTLSVLLPLKRVHGIDVSKMIADYRAGYDAVVFEAEEKTAQSASEMLSRLVLDDILEYAESLGTSCDVKVWSLKESDGGAWLYSVTVEYSGSAENADIIAEYIESLGISKDRQRHLLVQE